jgi:hypothetical protein
VWSAPLVPWSFSFTTDRPPTPGNGDNYALAFVAVPEFANWGDPPWPPPSPSLSVVATGHVPAPRFAHTPEPASLVTAVAGLVIVGAHLTRRKHVGPTR